MERFGSLKRGGASPNGRRPRRSVREGQTVVVQPNFAVTETFSAVDVVEHLSPFEDYWTQADRVLDDMRKYK